MSHFRNYVILRRWAGSIMWEQFTAQYARTRRQAIEQALVGVLPSDYAEAYMAIPALYWNPVEGEQLK